MPFSVLRTEWINSTTKELICHLASHIGVWSRPTTCDARWLHVVRLWSGLSLISSDIYRELSEKFGSKSYRNCWHGGVYSFISCYHLAIVYIDDSIILPRYAHVTHQLQLPGKQASRISTPRKQPYHQIYIKRQSHHQNLHQSVIFGQ